MRWDGLEDFRRQLRALPGHLADDARPIVRHAAQSAHRDAAAHYPEQSHTAHGTGNLRNGLRVDTSRDGGTFGTIVRLQNRAPHARIYEIGTAARQTSLGYNRGVMPPGRVFWPAVGRAKRVMWQQLMALLHKQGLTVPGAP